MVGRQGQHLRRQIFPGFSERTLAQIINAVRVQERGTETKPAIITDTETVSAGPAIQEMPGSRLGDIGMEEESFTLFFQRPETFLVVPLYGCNLIRG